ncbi:hypothetical protein GUJ93_ZPchr0007g6326 [Zizania palustris]|uniref:Uncharacterized protein n=1 Tax=Zizania palustris TaxID=103762 RepID=A0A8J5VU60_ZIZPA|nr:hypothetical protein GUJ93_ZPchr0007g6326 [Zizania palustris]
MVGAAPSSLSPRRPSTSSLYKTRQRPHGAGSQPLELASVPSPRYPHEATAPSPCSTSGPRASPVAIRARAPPATKSRVDHPSTKAACPPCGHHRAHIRPPKTVDRVPPLLDTRMSRKALQEAISRKTPMCILQKRDELTKSDGVVSIACIKHRLEKYNFAVIDQSRNLANSINIGAGYKAEYPEPLIQKGLGSLCSGECTGGHFVLESAQWSLPGYRLLKCLPGHPCVEQGRDSANGLGRSDRGSAMLAERTGGSDRRVIGARLGDMWRSGSGGCGRCSRSGRQQRLASRGLAARRTPIEHRAGRRSSGFVRIARGRHRGELWWPGTSSMGA